MKALLAAIALALIAPAFAQAPVTPQTPAYDGAADVHEQMRQLVLQIERGLKRIDALLWDADVRPASGEAPSLAETLNAVRDRSRRVVEDIDRLMEIRHHPHPPGGS